MNIFSIAEALDSQGRHRRWGMLGLCAVPLVGAYFNGYGIMHLSFDCPFRAMTGILCPTCGMTRSFITFAQGDVGLAAQYHLFGPLLLIICALSICHIMLELSIKSHVRSVFTQTVCSRIFGFSGLSLYLIYYLIRLINWFQPSQFSQQLFPLNF